MHYNKLLAACAFTAMVFGASAPVFAKPSPPPSVPVCPAVSACSIGSVTYTETGGTSGDGLTFLASFSPANQSNSTIATDVLAYLTAAGFSGEEYLGRQNGTGLVDGDNVTTSSTNNGLSGTWTLTLGSGMKNFDGEFIAIHAGGGQTTDIYEINSPGLSGTWSTFSTAQLSNFDLFGMDPPPGQTPVPEPVTLSLFGAGLAGAAALRRRKKAKA